MISISEIFWYKQSVFILQNKIYSFLRQRFVCTLIGLILLICFLVLSREQFCRGQKTFLMCLVSQDNIYVQMTNMKENINSNCIQNEALLHYVNYYMYKLRLLVPWTVSVPQGPTDNNKHIILRWGFVQKSFCQLSDNGSSDHRKHRL